MRRWLADPTGHGVAATALAIAAMAVDHLMGDDPGLEDPPAFLFSAALCVLVAAVLFGFVVPRASEERAGRRALVVSALAVLSLPLAFLGFFFVFAAAGLELGRKGRGRSAAAAVAVGAAVVLLGLVGYAYVAVTKL